jgi:hypothetical protein
MFAKVVRLRLWRAAQLGREQGEAAGRALCETIWGLLEGLWSLSGFVLIWLGGLLATLLAVWLLVVAIPFLWDWFSAHLWCHLIAATVAVALVSISAWRGRAGEFSLLCLLGRPFVALLPCRLWAMVGERFLRGGPPHWWSDIVLLPYLVSLLISAISPTVLWIQFWSCEIDAM